MSFFRKEGEPEQDNTVISEAVKSQQIDMQTDPLSSEKVTKVSKGALETTYDPNSEGLRVLVKKTGTFAYMSSTSLTSSGDFLKPTKKGLECFTRTINGEIEAMGAYSPKALDNRSFTVLTAWLSFLTELPLTVDEGVKIYGGMNRELVAKVVTRLSSEKMKPEESLLFDVTGKLEDPVKEFQETGNIPSDGLPPISLAINASLKIPLTRNGEESKMSMTISLRDRKLAKKLDPNTLEEFLYKHFVSVVRNRGIDKVFYLLASLEKHARNKVDSQENLMKMLLELHSIAPETKGTMPASGLEKSFEREEDLIDQAGDRLYKVLEDYTNQALKEYLDIKEKEKRKELDERAEALKRELSKYFQ